MAFAAVSSVARILDQMLQHQSLILQNRGEVESLFKEVISFQTVLEDCSQKSSKNIASFESEMVNASYKARDLIVTHIREQISRVNNWLFSAHELLNEAEGEIDAVVQRLKVIDRRVIEPVICSLSVLDYDIKLAKALDFERARLIFIVGVAGMGKTTLARQIFKQFNFLFQICAWATVSESYDVKQILIDLLHSSLGNCPEEMHQKTTQQLQEYLYRSLEGAQYLIVLDDLSDIQVLDLFTQILPKDGKSRGHILVTTKHENLAVSAKPSHLHRMTLYWQNMCSQHVIQNGRKEAESLLQKVSLLRGIIFENSSQKSTEEINTLENQIINAEKRVKAFIESRVIEYNLTLSPECLMQVKGEIDLVKKLAIKIDEEAENKHCLPDATPTGSITAKDFTEIKNQLAQQSSKREIVSLVGMAGIGKTTLARQVYEDKFFIKNFPIHAWVTVSQSYDRQKVLIDLLDSMKKDGLKMDKKSTDGDLSEHLYKRLKCWKYLIVIDDVWDTKVWDDLRRIFPDDNCSSRILLTTRLENVAVHANSFLHHVHFLNKGESWRLFCQVFGEYSCPPQLEEIGKMLVENCRGLPLAIVVIAGLLSRATRTKEYWEMVSRNLSSLMLSNGNDHCLQIISLSYTHLSYHMKKCFLYIGIFPEDTNILVSRLVKLWIAEGFIESLNSNGSIEDRAYKTLSDLVGRSLLMVDGHSSTGKIKSCKIHDLVRDFCTREAKREMLFHITNRSLYGIPVDAKIPLRLSIHPNTTNIIMYDEKKLSSLEVSSLHIFDPIFHYSTNHLNREPLRVLDMGTSDKYDGYSQWKPNEYMSHNLRYLSFEANVLSIPSSSVLPKLQTLILCRTDGMSITKFPNMWNMAQLRHVKVSGLCLSDPVEGENSVIVLENLQTLSHVYNFRWSKEVLGRIPNLKKLGIIYKVKESDWQHFYLENLMCLQKLEALTCTFLEEGCTSLMHILTFPPSLKILTLEGCRLPWKDMKIVGSLPNLEVLKLRFGSFEGEEWEWEATEEEFPNLIYLLLEQLDLARWIADTVSFPRLQRLIFRHCFALKEIPHCIGEIPTLRLIELQCYNDSIKDLVKEMQEEQTEFGNEGLEFRILRW